MGHDGELQAEGQTWICLFCPKSYPTYEKLVDHLFQEHLDDMTNIKVIDKAMSEGVERLKQLDRLRQILEDERVQEFFAGRRN